ncbi:MAG: hypothetical protein GTO33_07715 [Acidobacteria bacterium]|nr:hypothetical protein [Acidobacteriota bacterium]NIO59216.1 hypothetical protein [Acidobacteriota bacterium]NIQ85171.1 hypothetical protein [Acidobacteriota bacterium]NIT10926.1 hypothetical protein [Acidobacteriota bacterium]
MNRGAGGRSVFPTRGCGTRFLRLLGEISTTFRVEVHAYCLMANHYHLLARTPVAGLGRAMRHLDGVYTQWFNKVMKTDGPLFRGRYKAVLIGEDAYLRCVSRYIHLNPVEAQILGRPEHYEGSSYRAYLGIERAPLWLHTEETLAWFAPGNLRDNYRRFVESGIDEETRSFYEAARLPPVMGSEEFRRTARQRADDDGRTANPEQPDVSLIEECPTLDAIERAVCRAFRISSGQLRHPSKRRDGSSAARGAFALLARELGCYPLGQIAERIGHRSYAGASKSMGRLRRRMAVDRETRDRIEAARNDLSVSCQDLTPFQNKVSRSMSTSGSRSG